MTPEQLAAVLQAMTVEFRAALEESLRASNAELLNAAIAILDARAAEPPPANAPADPPPAPADPPPTATTDPDPSQANVDNTIARWQADEASINRMVEITATQPDRYDTAAVAVLQIEAVANRETPVEFAAKLRTIQIQPNPIAPGDASQRTYSLPNLLTAMAQNDGGLARHELAISNEIKGRVIMQPSNPAAAAIPLHQVTGDAMARALEEANTRVSIDTGTGAAGTAVPTVMQPFLRSDVPDPLRIEGLLSTVPNTAGNSDLVKVTVPKPAMVGEPDDNGYAKTGDTSATVIALTPHIQLQRTLITRLAGVQLPQLLVFHFSTSMDRMYEVENEQLVMGTGTGHEVKGVIAYGGTDAGDIAETAELTGVAGLTAAVVQDALDQSFMYPGDMMGKRIVVSPNARAAWQNTARPAAVGMLYENGRVSGVQVEETRYMTGSDGSKVARGFVGPLADMYRKTWDDAIYVTQYYEAGNHYLELERFWDAVIAHAQLWKIFKDDA